MIPEQRQLKGSIRPSRMMAANGIPVPRAGRPYSGSGVRGGARCTQVIFEQGRTPAGPAEIVWDNLKRAQWLWEARGGCLTTSLGASRNQFRYQGIGIGSMSW